MHYRGAMQINRASTTDDGAAMAAPMSSSKSAKYISLSCLTLQNVALIIAMRYSRTRQGDKYIMTTAVVMSEMIKLLSCLVIIYIQEGSYRHWWKHLYSNIVQQPLDCLKISIPGLVYMVQNNLLYVAVANLEATTFQVMYQLKILTTALFTVIMLGKKLSRIQWLSLMVLFVGVSVIIHLQSSQHSINQDVTAEGKDQSPILGIVAVLISCVLSGFAGVYFEKLLKNTPQSLYIRNVQLGIFGTVAGLITALMFDKEQIIEKGFFFGYDQLVTCVILLQSVGGILVAVVVKYADNILKGFATSAAIILSCIVSIFFFDFMPTLSFLLASSMVICSVYMYNSGSTNLIQLIPLWKRNQEVV